MIDLGHHKGYMCKCGCWVVPRDGDITCLNCSFKRNMQAEGPGYEGSDIDQRMIKAGECTWQSRLARNHTETSALHSPITDL